ARRARCVRRRHAGCAVGVRRRGAFGGAADFSSALLHIAVHRGACDPGHPGDQAVLAGTAASCRRTITATRPPAWVACYPGFGMAFRAAPRTKEAPILPRHRRAGWPEPRPA